MARTACPNMGCRGTKLINGECPLCGYKDPEYKATPEQPVEEKAKEIIEKDKPKEGWLARGLKVFSTKEQ